MSSSEIREASGEETGPMPELDVAPRGSELLETFRGALSQAEGARPVNDADLAAAVEIVQRGADDETAQELLSSVHRLNETAHESHNDTIEPWLVALKRAAYMGDASVQPSNQIHYLQKGRHVESGTFEWTGLPIDIKVPGADGDHAHPNPNARAQLMLGPEDTWYISVGRNQPYALESNHPVKMGRAPHGSNFDPRYLGSNNNTSREQLILNPTPPVGIEITDTSTLGTTITTHRYPTPSEYRAWVAGQHETAQRARADAARQQIDDLQDA